MTGDLAPWPDCAEMAYKPRSRPNFPGDIQHDLRDYLYDTREETISTWINWAVDDYLQAARLLNRMDDPVADSLPYAFPFDMAIFQVAHDHMAAHWREHCLPGHMKNAVTFCPNVDDKISTRSYRGIRMEFRAFLLRQLIGWNRQRPELVRQLCLVLVRQNTVEGYLEEINLYDLLKVAYPVTSIAPSHGDAG